jgi:multidrug resistance protein, MATE family
MISRTFSRTAATSILRLAGPTALSRLGVMAMGVTDTIMVGQLAPHALPALALGNAMTAVFLVASFGLLTGVQVWTARVMGEGRPAAAGGVWRRGVALALISGSLAIPMLWFGGAPLLRFFGVEGDLVAPASAVMGVLGLSLPLHLTYVASALFLEALRRPFAALVVMWGANLLNIALNITLIPELGAVGSAWATVGSRAFLAGALVAWLLCLRDGRALGLRGGSSSSAGPPVGTATLLRVGAAAAVSQGVEAGAFSAMTVIAGRISAEVVAAYAILLNLLSLAFMVAMGLATATAVTVSEAIGRGDRRAAAQAAWTGLWLSSAAMAGIGLIFLAGAEPIAQGFTSDFALSGLVMANMAWAAAVLIPDGGQYVAASSLRARGDNWAPTASHILAYAVVMPGIAYVLAERMGQGVAGLLAAIFWSSVLSVGILAARQAILIRRG